ncbi:hypothetical protein H1O16_gp074 [Burkholderia phage BcepSaruman]|uniref:Uncharacterized protein n=1 Tax=Burkholderia phage BcepSaruman TaxID=2530032 RepID=A0A4D5ZE02_9CAUD|nr:hypothetical protein H1O16_gp074 [Burkholderia phage BcepSaruman]QBX06487.1 hypothetical protein BcepSaruman_074 [Burkholderia phage BcepSaruman]
MQTVSITDYDLVSPKLARVVIAFTGKFNKETLRASLTEKFEAKAAPVEDSFREVRAGVAVGFMRANREVRVVDPQELRASYRVVGSSNIMTSDADDSLWEVKTGKGGTYLARHGNEDLSELIHASTKRRTDVPGLRHITTASAVPGEFVAYVSQSGDMDYGFAIAANAEKVQVVSHASDNAVVVDNKMVASIVRAPIPKSFADKMVQAGISRADKQQAIEYWKQLYSYDPAYLRMVIDQVNEDATA